MEFDPGPPAALAALFATLPDHRPFKKRFRLEWGPVLYRGRTDGSARVLVIGQDAASEENVARRCLVGDAGRRVQGFLAKLGVTRSYVMLNAYAFSIFGQFNAELRAIAERPEFLGWRNRVLDHIAAAADLQLIVAFGNAAGHVVDHWPGSNVAPVVRAQHPSAKNEAALLATWRAAVVQARQMVAADPGASRSARNYGTSFKASELPDIPRRDLPFGMPSWFTAGTRTKSTRRDGELKIVWTAPKGSVG
jgi:hypothetical protein